MSLKQTILLWIAFIAVMFFFLFMAITESVCLKKEKPAGELRIEAPVRSCTCISIDCSKFKELDFVFFNKDGELEYKEADEYDLWKDTRIGLVMNDSTLLVYEN